MSWVANTGTHGAKLLENAGFGVYAPQWCADGESIMYIAENCLWLIDAQGGQRHKLASLYTEERANANWGMSNYLLAWHKN